MPHFAVSGCVLRRQCAPLRSLAEIFVGLGESLALRGKSFGIFPKAEWNRDNTPLRRLAQGLSFFGGIMNNIKQKIKKKAPIRNPIKHLMNDVELVKSRDPAARSTAEVLLLYPGLHAMFAYRIANRLYKGEHYFSARCLSQLARAFTGIEIHPGATIGEGLFIDHGMGVVIGETTEIGDNCTLYQGVTLGGTGKDQGKRHPTLGDNVLVGAGARVLGPINIGDNSKIASGAVVLRDVPENSTAVGIPARVVRRDGAKTEQLLDHANVPDPVAKELSAMKEKLEALQKELAELKESKK